MIKSGQRNGDDERIERESVSNLCDRILNHFYLNLSIDFDKTPPDGIMKQSATESTSPSALPL